jgi:hypothetical protein
VSGHRRRAIDTALMVAIAMSVAAFALWSYRTYRPCAGEAASCAQIDPLSGDPAARWSVYGALSADQVTFARAGADSVEVKIHSADRAWVTTDSGVSNTSGLYAPGWYEFTAELSSNGGDADDQGVQIELYSDNWRFASKGQHFQPGNWRRIDIYFRPADYNPVVEISCRFLGAPADTPAVAMMRNMRIVRLAGAAPLKRARFDMQQKRETRFKPQRGKRRRWGLLSLIATVVALGAVIGGCWRLLD